MNLSATFNVLRLFFSPHLCVPQMTINSFGQLPVPIGPKIKAVVLDKDNCFAFPHENKVWPEYEELWQKLKNTYPGASMLIVSNSAGSSDDSGHAEALLLEKVTGVPVLRHSSKKPGCRDQILEHFYREKVIESPQEIAVVGDRLFTDILMANLMGSYPVWVKEGVKLCESPICRFEKILLEWLRPEK
ncbi:LAMI_0B03840g1_1 [Lachancea mirantina]|uniref:LAMI_0B03840g1_1 n=1 Tax=Lachancea mirantina TaxID=1230905 RepID=A0A1G4IVB5_9SACH|nr:LAMI_0B03840g1_1 [Lachancea mirantina]